MNELFADLKCQTMPDKKAFLFHDDPKKFMELLLMNDAAKRFDALKANSDDVILCEIIRYGIFNDPQMIGPLAQLYEKSVVASYAEEKRWELYQHVIGMVENVEVVSINALLPFIAEEPSRRIVSTAVIDYVSLGPLTNNDAMSRPKDIIEMIENGQMKNRGAAFGGLLHIGDPRVCKLLWPLREVLNPDEINVAVNCSAGILYSSSLEFELDWLDELIKGGSQGNLFGIVASGLVLQKRKNQFDGVCTGQRPFPFPKNPSTAEARQLHEAAKPISIEEYTKRIAPRLYALESVEPPPRVMPIVLSEWNLTPSSDPREVAVPPSQEPATRSGGKKPSYKRILTELGSRPCRLVVAGGIVNPMGPTLAALLMLGTERGINWNLYRLILNPFQQGLTRLRDGKMNEAGSPSAIIREQGLGFAAAPTFLFFGGANPDEICACSREIALTSNNLASTVDRLRRFPGNPWDRISEEMQKSFKPTSDSNVKRKTTDQDVQDYMSMIFDGKNLREEISAFKEAWRGSIEFQASSGNSELAKTAMPLGDLEEAISILLGSDEKNLHAIS